MAPSSKSPTPGFSHVKVRANHHQDQTTNMVGIDPITLMINECMILSSAMRKSTRWSQSGVAAILGAGDIFGEDESLTHSLGLSSSVSNNGVRPTSDNPLFSSFLQLRAILTDAVDIYQIDSLTLLQPFLLAVKSSSTSGHITSLALNSISKFLKYEIISYKSENLQSTLVQISSSLTHCRFEAADQNSDDAVLLKVLRLLEEIIESPLSNLLPNEVVSEIIQTCLSLACNKKRNEVLRRAAEMAMISITFRIFTKLKHIKPESKNDDLQTNFNDTQLPEDIIGGTEYAQSLMGTPVPEIHPVQEDSENRSEELDTTDKQGTAPASKPKEPSKSELEEPYDIICINEFLGILISMISPTNQYQHMESTRVFALNLINTAIEVSGIEIPKHPSLLSLVSDPISKHIVQIITTTDSPALLQASLQLFSTLAIMLGTHLKSQIELTLTLISQSILPSTSKNTKQTDNLKNANVSSRNPISKEMLIESLSLLWTRSPTFFTNLFIDYDCDFDKSDLAVKLLEFLCKLSLSESSTITTENVPPICLESILLFISGVNDRIKGLNKDLSDLPIPQLIENKNQKTSFIKCADLLNDKPKEGIKALESNGFISDQKNIPELANFFFTKSGRLNKKVLGEFLAKPSSIEILRSFIKLFDFAEMRVDEALRILLKTFRLPGESQQIERIVELFAERYVECQAESDANAVKLSEEEKDEKNESAQKAPIQEPVRPDRDSVFILSYSIILLNTDLHNPQVKKQMMLDDYKRNLRGVYNGKDFPEWYLAKIYQTIKDKEIIMPEEHHGTDKWFDDTWNNLISIQALSSPIETEHSSEEVCQFDKVLFESIIEILISTLISVFKEASDDHIITRLMSSIDKCANICLYYNLGSSIDKLIGFLADLTTLTSTGVSSRASASPSADDLRDEIPVTQIRLEEKQQTITTSEMSVWFGRDFKAQLSVVVLFRLIKKNDCKISPSWSKIIEIIFKLFENCLLEPNLFSDFQKKLKIPSLSKVRPRFTINKTKPVNSSGLLSTFSSFLKGYSDQPPEPTDQEIESTLSTIDCVKSINIPSIFEMISRGPPGDLALFVELLLESFPKYNDESKRYYETETLFLLEICVCFALLAEDDTLFRKVLSKSDPEQISPKNKLRLLCYKLLLFRKVTDGKIENKETETPSDISTIKSLIVDLHTFDKEILSKQGAQLVQPILSLIDHESWCFSQLINDEDYWKVLRLLGSIQILAPELLDFVEGLLKNSPKDISPDNYMFVLGLLDEISSSGAIGSQFEQESDAKQIKIDDPFYEDLVVVSKRSITLTHDLQAIVQREDFNSNDLSFSLIQALAHQCFNPCREVRGFALSNLQLLVLSVETTDHLTPHGIFEYGLFPLLSELSKIEVLQTDPKGFVKTQSETLSLTSKVFLKYSNDFKGEEINQVWLGILDHINTLNEKGAKVSNQEVAFKESVSELIKNMVLVLQSNGILTPEKEEIWSATWQKIEGVNPELQASLMPQETKVEQVEQVEEKEQLEKQDEEKEKA
ncbi:GDP/GTP exchange factor for ARF [Suhomyces tanzawaensis NRRL Y-17324]|uniref:GDP/GTP exchange factor for ARF n=1 Tax=Suhomyces tanzawaensis NRRL Y-17324 TaxID=984487 RepID=A0A1E4SB98_9ASCO|nr:GDP/GTP exchange factor for ARF [Suhomyces tanzawaensis NRRL Y-17324]ODV76794.1 GDP/GTP exchange factor for ARF [Suhomyces tanzawaensis NRRL Y-17324]